MFVTWYPIVRDPTYPNSMWQIYTHLENWLHFDSQKILCLVSAFFRFRKTAK